jgi:hypothetical protein
MDTLAAKGRVNTSVTISMNVHGGNHITVLMYFTASAGNTILCVESGESTRDSGATTIDVGLLGLVVGVVITCGGVATRFVLGRGFVTSFVLGRVAFVRLVFLLLLVLLVVRSLDGRVFRAGTRLRFAFSRAIFLKGFGGEKGMATVIEESGVVLVLAFKGEIAAMVFLVFL